MINYLLTTLLLCNSIFFSAIASDENSFAIEKLPKNYNQLNFKEVGRAKFSVLFWDIYNSTLYTKSGKYLHENSPEPLIFEIEYLRDITTEELLERTVQQWKYLEISEAEYSRFIPTLQAMWPNISAGDRLTMLVQNKQSIFYFNGVKTGQIQQKEFSKLFLDIWLSPKTSQEKLRKELLGRRG